MVEPCVSGRKRVLQWVGRTITPSQPSRTRNLLAPRSRRILPRDWSSPTASGALTVHRADDSLPIPGGIWTVSYDGPTMRDANCERTTLWSPPQVLTVFFWEAERLLAALLFFLPEFGRCGGSKIPRSWWCVKGWPRVTPGKSRAPHPLMT